MVSVITTVEEPPKPLGVARLWRRELDAYPGAGARVAYLAIVVLTTVLFYYQY